jgi:hypothetical protein
MSVEAMAYVLPLVECPDGADLNAGMKNILLVLSNCHNPHSRVAWPSMKTIAVYSRLSLDTVQRHIRYLQDHCLIEQRAPKSFGSGIKYGYVFLFLDDPGRLAELLHEKSKGVQGAPLFAPPQRGAEGVQSTDTKGGRRGATAPRIKEEPVSKSLEPEPCVQPFQISTDCPTWKGLPHGLQEKVRRELRSILEATMGTRGYDGDRTAEQIASAERNAMLTACDRAGIWANQAEKIAAEFYNMALHEESAKRNRMLEAPNHGADLHG